MEIEVSTHALPEKIWMINIVREETLIPEKNQLRGRIEFEHEPIQSLLLCWGTHFISPSSPEDVTLGSVVVAKYIFGLRFD